MIHEFKELKIDIIVSRSPKQFSFKTCVLTSIEARQADARKKAKGKGKGRKGKSRGKGPWLGRGRGKGRGRGQSGGMSESSVPACGRPSASENSAVRRRLSFGPEGNAPHEDEEKKGDRDAKMEVECPEPSPEADGVHQAVEPEVASGVASEPGVASDVAFEPEVASGVAPEPDLASDVAASSVGPVAVEEEAPRNAGEAVARGPTLHKTPDELHLITPPCCSIHLNCALVIFSVCVLQFRTDCFVDTPFQS